MSTIRQWWRRLGRTLTAASGDDALKDDIEAHLAELADDFMAQGMPPDEARLAARRAFGGIDQMREAYRDQERLPLLDALLQDLRFGLRLLLRDRGFTLVVVSVLGVGLGVNNLYFTLTYAATMRGLPLDRADRVVFISMSDERTPDRPVSWPDFSDIAATQRSFAGVAAFASQPATVGDEGRAPDRFDGAYASASAFDLLGIQAVHGRTFTADDDRVGAAPVALLGERAWRLRYASDRAVVGRELLVNGLPATLVGIVPERSGFPATAEVWLPLSQMPGLASQPRDAYRLSVIGRLRDSVSLDRAREDVQSIVDDIAAVDGREMRAKVVPIDERMFQRLEGPWAAFLLAAFLVVVISSANVANLMIGRSVRRAHELAIRASLGAGRTRLVCQLLVESVLLAVIAVVLGTAISLAGSRIFRGVVPDGTLPYWIDFSMDGRVFAGLCLVAAGTLAVFGVIPALLVSRANANDVLKNGRRTGSVALGAGRWTAAFLAVELALAVVFISQAVLVALSDAPPLPSDAALDTDMVVAATVTLPAARYATADQRRAFYRDLVERVEQSPGVSAVAVTSHLPLAGSVERRVRMDRPSTEVAPGTQPPVAAVEIGPGYFEALNQNLVRGRPFTASDGPDGSGSVVVNQRFVELFLSDLEPIGQRIALTAPNLPAVAPEWLTIAGVAPDIKQRPGSQAAPIVYLPLLAGSPPTAVLMARAASSPATLAPTLRAAALSVDPNVALYRMTSLAQTRRDAEWNGRVSQGLALTLTLVSVLLATVGLYAVTAHAVTLRTQEIGIRMALGASSSQVIRTVLQNVRVPLILGFVLGIGGSIAWHRAFSFGSAASRVTDPRLLIIVGTMLTALALVACLVPVCRAIRLDPVAALREE